MQRTHGIPPGMRRMILLAVLGLSTGCSNAPVAGLMDCVAPARGGDAGREPVIPKIRPPGTGGGDNLPPGAIDVLPPVTPRQ